MAQDTAYKQNPLLKQRGVQIDFTKDQVKEIIKCSQDPEYFLSEYIKVISLCRWMALRHICQSCEWCHRSR